MMSGRGVVTWTTVGVHVPRRAFHAAEDQPPVSAARGAGSGRRHGLTPPSGGGRRGGGWLPVVLLLAGALLAGVAWWWPQAPEGLRLVDGELEVPRAVETQVAEPRLAGPTAAPAGAVDVSGSWLEVPAVGLRARIGSDLRARGAGDWVPPLADVGRWPASAGLDAGQGAVMLAGHVWVGDEPGVFGRLHELRPGNLLVLGAGGGREEFLVSRVQQVPRGGLPGWAWGAREGARRLVLVTCAGRVEDAAGQRVWSQNLVIEGLPRR